MFEQTFYEIASILILAAVIGSLAKLLRQPLIIAFLATGILAGPSGFSILQSHSQIETLAQIGIALLLFVVGLKLDLNLIKTTGPVALATGLGQVPRPVPAGDGPRARDRLADPQPALLLPVDRRAQRVHDDLPDRGAERSLHRPARHAAPVPRRPLLGKHGGGV